MAEKHLGKEWIHGLLMIIACMLLLAAAPRKDIFRGAVDWAGQILRYPEYPAVALVQVAKNMSSWFSEKGNLIERLDLLEKENSRLKLAWSMGSASHLKEELDRYYGYARVTLREPFSWWSEARISKGTSDGVSFGAPVLHNGYLTGRISSLGEDYSWVELITSSSLMIPVVIEETRDLGVVAGDGEGGLWLLYVPEGRAYAEGMTVSTAMVSEALPPGIPVGSLSSEKRKTGGSYYEWKVIPGANLNQLYALELLGGPGNGGKSR